MIFHLGSGNNNTLKYTYRCLFSPTTCSCSATESPNKLPAVCPSLTTGDLTSKLNAWQQRAALNTNTMTNESLCRWNTFIFLKVTPMFLLGETETESGGRWVCQGLNRSGFFRRCEVIAHSFFRGSRQSSVKTCLEGIELHWASAGTLIEDGLTHARTHSHLHSVIMSRKGLFKLFLMWSPEGGLSWSYICSLLCVKNFYCKKTTCCFPN